MNELLLTVGLAQWKPLVATLLLPPVPMLLLVLLGTRLLFSRRWLGWLLVLLGVCSLWLSCTTALSRALTLGALKPPLALNETAVRDLARRPRTAIVVLGGGRRFSAPEYGSTTLNARSMERLRYGIWLGRETALPLLFSGGSGRAEMAGPAEADLAARIAEREFKLPLRWTESQSRDTHENALRSVALLKSQGIEHIVLVTHAYHMPRALRNFEQAVARQALLGLAAAANPSSPSSPSSISSASRVVPIKVVAAPVARPTLGPWKLNDWLPSLRGFEENYLALHELLGLLAGA